MSDQNNMIMNDGEDHKKASGNKFWNQTKSLIRKDIIIKLRYPVGWGFTLFGQEISKSFYISNEVKDMDRIIKDLLDNKDPQKDLREKYIQQFFTPYKDKATSNVLSVLKNDLNSS